MKAYLFHCRSCEHCGSTEMDSVDNVSLTVSLSELSVGKCPQECTIRGTMWCNPSCRHWEQEHGAV